MRGLLAILSDPQYQASLEGEANGATAVELEHVWYGRLTDHSVLKEVRSESQEQWTIKADPGSEALYGGSLRVRSTNDSNYVLCAKVFQHGKQGVLENEIEVTKQMFELFRKMSPSGMIKRRYFFPVPDSELVFEVDVFVDADRNVQEWVKIDLEVKNSSVEIPELPIQLEDLFKYDPTNPPAELKQKVDELMSTVFCVKNQYQKD